MHKFSTQTKIPIAYFLIPFLVQILIILVIPSKSFYTYKTGQNVVIQTMPIDPYDLLRGYSQTLSYDISSLDNLRKLPGEKNLNTGDTFYLTLQAPKLSNKTPPLPWTTVAINHHKPENLAANQIALKGIISNYDIVKYGLETYYMPENQREKLNQEIQELSNQSNQNNQARPFVVEIKVDRFGNSLPVSLWIRNRNYRF
jgi:uncharacterized membrane-anchored protein